MSSQGCGGSKGSFSARRTINRQNTVRITTIPGEILCSTPQRLLNGGDSEDRKGLIWVPKTQPDNSSFSGCQIVVTRSKLPDRACYLDIWFIPTRALLLDVHLSARRALLAAASLDNSSVLGGDGAAPARRGWEVGGCHTMAEELYTRSLQRPSPLGQRPTCTDTPPRPT